MAGITFDYDVNDRASGKLDNIASKLRSLKRDAGETRRALTMATKGGAVVGALSGTLGSMMSSIGIGGGGDDADKPLVSSGDNAALDLFSGLGSLAAGGMVGRGLGKVLPSATWGGTGMLATTTMMIARGGVMAVAAYGVGKLVGGVTEAARPLISEAKVNNVTSISTADLENRQETTQRLLDSYLHRSYEGTYLYDGLYKDRKADIDMQLQMEGKKRTRELTDSMWMQYRE